MRAKNWVSPCKPVAGDEPTYFCVKSIPLFLCEPTIRMISKSSVPGIVKDQRAFWRYTKSYDRQSCHSLCTQNTLFQLLWQQLVDRNGFTKHSKLTREKDFSISVCNGQAIYPGPFSKWPIDGLGQNTGIKVFREPQLAAFLVIGV